MPYDRKAKLVRVGDDGVTRTDTISASDALTDLHVANKNKNKTMPKGAGQKQVNDLAGQWGPKLGDTPKGQDLNNNFRSHDEDKD